MVDLSGLGHAAIGQLKHLHNAAKNIETAHLGKLYTNAVDGFDLRVVEGIVKPFLNKHPEITDNGAVTFFQENKKISLISGGCLFLLFLILLHPNQEPRPPKNLDEVPAGDKSEKLPEDGDELGELSGAGEPLEGPSKENLGAAEEGRRSPTAEELARALGTEDSGDEKEDSLKPPAGSPTDPKENAVHSPLPPPPPPSEGKPPAVVVTAPTAPVPD